VIGNEYAKTVRVYIVALSLSASVKEDSRRRHSQTSLMHACSHVY
jgi:hypothetical protein